MITIAAEIGLNFNGSIDLAKQTIDAAHAAGCDMVKFQNYKTLQFIGERSENWTYINDGKEITESQFEMFRRHELSFEQLAELKKYCDTIGTGFQSTPMCRDGLNDLIALDVDTIKNGSDRLQDIDLIAAMAKTGKKVVISTGMSHLSEIDSAVRAFRGAGGKDLTLLQCCSAYPAPDDSMNISRIKTLRDVFGCDVGLSDHSEGIVAPILAVAYGATWYEAHMTIDKNLPGPDHLASKDPTEMKLIVESIRRAEKQIGTPELCMTEIERKNRLAWFRNV